MKKVLLMFIVIAASAGFVNAQGVSGGVKAGVNFTNIIGDDAPDGADMRGGFHVGGYVNYAFTENLSLQPELLYTTIGTDFPGEETVDDMVFRSKHTFELSYIALPVNVVYSFGVVNIHAGPQFSFLVSAKDEVEVDGFSNISGEVDIKDQLKAMDFGFNIGLGANFGKLNAAARYTLGLSNIVDADDVSVKTSNIQVSLGYRLFGGE